MAVLGARLLEEPPTSGVEAAETVKLRQAGERSVLARIAMTASDGLSKVMFLLASWVQPTVREDTIGVKLSTDFDVSKLDPTTLVALVQMTQAGLMSWQTLFWNIKRGEYVPDDVTEEDELSRIEQTMALLGLGRPEPGEEEGESGEEDEDDEEGGDDEDDEDDEEEDDEGEEE